MHGEAIRRNRHCSYDFCERVLRHRSRHRCVRIRRLLDGRAALEFRVPFFASLFFLRGNGLRLGERVFEPLPQLLLKRLGLLGGKNLFPDEFVAKNRADARVAHDVAIHIRAGESGIVVLVVAVAAVADHVHKNVALELLAKLKRQFHRVAHRERIIAIHVEDGCLHHLRHIGAIL